MGTICSSIFNKSYVHYTQTDKVVSHPIIKEFLVFQDVITGNLVFGKEINLNHLKIEDPERLERHQLFAHANVIKFEGFKKNDDVNYLALFESYESTLEQEIQERCAKNSKFTENEILSIFQSVSAALSYFQKKDIYYGQTRPENIVKKGDEYKLLDMIIFNETKTTYEELLQGNNDYETTQRFLSPELSKALSQEITTPEYEKYKQDIYSLGVIILDAMSLNISSDIPEKIQIAASRYSPQLIDLVRQTMKSDVKKRIDVLSCNRIVENMYYGFPISDETDPVYTGDLKMQVQTVVPEYYDVQISPYQNRQHSQISSPNSSVPKSYKQNEYSYSESPHLAKSQSVYSSNHTNSPTLSNQLFNDYPPPHQNNDLSSPPPSSKLKRAVHPHPVVTTTSPLTYEERNLSPVIKNDPVISEIIKEDMRKHPTQEGEEDYASPTRRIMAEANALLRSMEKNASISIHADSSPEPYIPRKIQQSPDYSPDKYVAEQRILTTEAHTTKRHQTQKTSRNGDSGNKPLENSPFIFNTSPDQNERHLLKLNLIPFSSKDLYGDEGPYSFRPYNPTAADVTERELSSYRNLLQAHDTSSHLIDPQNRKITPIAMSETKPYDLHYTASSADFFANNMSMQPAEIASRRYEDSYLSKDKSKEGRLHMSSADQKMFSNLLLGDRNQENNKHAITKETELIDQRIQQIDSMIHNVNELNKKISANAKSSRDYDNELFRSKSKSFLQDKTNNGSDKKSRNPFDTLETKLSQFGLSKPNTLSLHQSSINPRSSRTMGYALEVLRNDMKHNFLTEVDDFLDKRLTPPRKKKNDRLKTLENEIEHIRKTREIDFQQIPTLANEVEDLGIRISSSNLRFSRINRKAPQIGGEEVIKNKVFVVETYKDGSKYEGELQGGLRHGQGKLTYSDGTWFDGTWILDRIEGYGAFYYETSKVSYEGEWKNNKREGTGVMYNEQVTQIGEGYLERPFDRSENTWERYEGEFKSDDWHGNGRLALSNGDVFQGTFKKGRIQGRGTYRTSRGELVIGEWKENTLTRIY